MGLGPELWRREARKGGAGPACLWPTRARAAVNGEGGADRGSSRPIWKAAAANGDIAGDERGDGRDKRERADPGLGTPDPARLEDEEAGDEVSKAAAAPTAKRERERERERESS